MAWPWEDLGGWFRDAPILGAFYQAGAATRGIVMGRDEAGNPIDYQGNRVSVPGRLVPPPASPTAPSEIIAYRERSVWKPQILTPTSKPVFWGGELKSRELEKGRRVLVLGRRSIVIRGRRVPPPAPLPAYPEPETPDWQPQITIPTTRQISVPGRKIILIPLPAYPKPETPDRQPQITIPITPPTVYPNTPAVITVNPPVRLATPPITRKNILAMPQGVTNDTLTKLIGLNDSIKYANIYQTLKVSRSM